MNKNTIENLIDWDLEEDQSKSLPASGPEEQSSEPDSGFDFRNFFLGAATVVVFSAGWLTTSDGLRLLFALTFALSFSYLYRLKGLGFFGAWLMGVGMHAIAGYWGPGALAGFVDWPTGLPLVVTVATWLFGALQFGAVPLLARRIEKAFPIFKCTALALSWLTLEIWFPRIIPWNLGHLTVGLPVLSQSASLLGAPLLSFLLIWWASAAVAARLDGSDAIRQVAAPALSFVMVVSYGAFHLRSLEVEAAVSPKLSAALIQANLNSSSDFTLANWAKNIERHRKLSELAALDGKVDLFIWPESAVGTDFTADRWEILPTDRLNPYPNAPAPLLFGGQVRLPNKGKYLRYLVSAFLLLPDGAVAGRYDKRTFIPFAEVIPLEEQFPILQSLHRGIYEVGPGGMQESLKLPLAGENRKKTLVGVSICYEEAFADAFESAGQDYPNVLVSMSNDGWLGGSAAVEQHLLISRFRAIESGRFLLRATNDGVTAVVDPAGRIAGRLPENRADFLRFEKVVIFGERTVFSRFGLRPLKIGTAVLLLLLVMFSGRLKRDSTRK